MPLARSLSFADLICSSLCAPQSVGDPRSLDIFQCPEFYLFLRAPVGECPSFVRIFFTVLILFLSTLSSG